MPGYSPHFTSLTACWVALVLLSVTSSPSRAFSGVPSIAWFKRPSRHEDIVGAGGWLTVWQAVDIRYCCCQTAQPPPPPVTTAKMNLNMLASPNYPNNCTSVYFHYQDSLVKLSCLLVQHVTWHNYPGNSNSTSNMYHVHFIKFYLQVLKTQYKKLSM